MNDVRSRLAVGTIWMTAARGAVNVFGVISTAVLARLLTPSDFGVVALGMTVTAILGAVTNLSMAAALVQHKDPTRGHFDTAWTLAFCRGLVLAGALAGLAHPLALAFREPRLEPLLYALTVGPVFDGLANPRNIMLTRDLVFWQQFMLQVSQKLIGLIAGLVVALMTHSYWALVAGTLCGQFSGLLISYTVLPFLPRFSLRHWKDLMSFSIWLTLQQLFNTINWRFDQLLVGGFLSRAALGYYTVGDNLAVIPTRETTAPLTNTLFPAFARIRENRQRMAAAYQSAQVLITAIALPAGVGMALVADPLIRLAMGEKWRSAIFVVQTIASVYAFQTIGTLAQPLAMSNGQSRMLFTRDLQAFFMRLPIIFIGMKFGGLPGLLYARVLTGSFSSVLSMQVVKRLTGLSYAAQLGANKRTFASVAAMAAAVGIVVRLLVLPQTPLWLAVELAARVGAGLAVYVGVRLLLWRTAGTPQGPESEMIGMARQLWGALLRARVGAPSRP
jgi:O-antigen/teichoic acid export membrane protein